MPTPAISAPIPRRKFTLGEYHWLGEQDFFPPGERVELIRGEIVTMAAKSTKHTVCSRELLGVLTRLVAPGWQIQCQDPISLPNASEPEPDFAVVRVREDRYICGHPTPSDIILLIEISDSSLDYDRDVKGLLYAQAGISDYWLFNLVDQQVEVYQKPELGTYSSCRIFSPNELTPLPQFPERLLPLYEVFIWIELDSFGDIADGE